LQFIAIKTQAYGNLQEFCPSAASSWFLPCTDSCELHLLQLHCLQYLIHELVSGGSLRKAGGFFSGNDVDISPGDMRQLENFFSRLAFFPHILDYRGTTPIVAFVFWQGFFFMGC
jgi:hypothetical protein